ncbi:MAG: glycosyltransferase [Xenococcaceae cyanobacterium MO_188.B32]|nr:glycosyltransferase [Xenococcaceae cyanobacterium MO_188.B32]
MTKVSVIIPTYNSGRYIEEAIDSVLAQTYTNYEIIVVDDGSTDNTSQIVQAYGDRVLYWYQENQGVASARNVGIEKAKGELIAFLDADDFFLPEKLAKQVAYFEEDSSLGMTISGWRLVDERGKKIFDAELWQYAPQLDLATAIIHKPARPSATMLSRYWCQKVNGFNTSLSSAEDLDFLLRLLLMGCEAYWLPEVLTCYRQHFGSLMSGGKTLLKNTETVIEKFFARPDLPENILKLKERERYQCLVWLACRMYYDGYLTEMAECLQKSLQYTNFTPETAAFNWIENFKNYALQHGHNFDVYSLINSVAWQQITNSSPHTAKIAVPTIKLTKAIENKILLYTDDLGIGGVRQCNHAIISHLANLGYQVTHVHYPDNSPLSQKERDLAIEQVNLDYHAGIDIIRTMKDVRGSAKIFAATQPALVIFSDGWPFSNLAAKQAAIEMEIPYIIVLGFIEPSCIYFSLQDGVPYRDTVTYHYSQAQAVIGVSQENLHLLRKLFQLSNRVGKVIYNGRPSQYFAPPNVSTRQSLRRELNIPSDAVVCFTSARLEPVKGYQYQLEAIQQLKDSTIWSQLYFVWAGTGIESGTRSNEQELKQKVQQLEISDRVIFLGQRWDIPDWLDASDIFILTSEAEGMPLSVMEAMAKGLPVIATAVSGIPEELGYTGKLLTNPQIDPQETVGELVNTICLWASTPALRHAIGQAGKRRAEELFTEENMIKQYQEVIDRVLAKQSFVPTDKLNPEKISLIKKRFQYSSLVWQAWKNYRQGNMSAMATFLQQAWQFTPYSPNSTVFNWIRHFSHFSREQGDKLDTYSLVNSPEWKQLI